MYSLTWVRYGKLSVTISCEPLTKYIHQLLFENHLAREPITSRASLITKHSPVAGNMQNILVVWK